MRTLRYMVHRQVRAARRKHELSQDEVAKALGISRQSYINFEFHDHSLPRGMTPSDAIAVIERLASQSTSKAS